MRTQSLVLAVAALLPVAVFACKAEIQAKVNTGEAPPATSDEKRWEDAQKETWAAASASAKPAAAPRPGGWIGVVHDLSLSESKAHTPVCQCVAAFAGSPSDPGFAWRGSIPQTDEDTIAVATGGEGVTCGTTIGRGANAHTPVPSIAGVERVGDDVIVELEEAREGRPTVHGALVKRPGPNGSILLRAHGALPFGKPLDGSKNPCKVPIK